MKSWRDFINARKMSYLIIDIPEGFHHHFTGLIPIKKGKIVGNYLSFINLNLIVEFGRTALLRTFFII